MDKYDLIVALGKNWREYPKEGDKRIVLSLESKLISLALFELMNKGAAKRAIISAGKTAGQNWPSEGKRMLDYVLHHGYEGSVKDIFLEDESIDTAENAEKTKRIIRPYEKNIGLLSISFHFPRAERIFRSYGVEANAIYAEDVLRGLNAHTDKLLREYKNSGRYLFEKVKEILILNPISIVDRRGKALRYVTSRIRGKGRE